MSTKLKVGDLAERTGLTVRTLHHYDDIGLLRPAERTASGHRLYGVAEIERLHRIASLRHVGLPLEAVATCLDRPGHDLDDVLALQIERIREGMAEAGRLLSTLEDLRARLRDGEADIDDLVRTIHMTKMHEKYYTPEQREQLARRAEAVGKERMEEVGREWERLFADLERAFEAALDPASPEAQAMAARYDALIAEFTGGDEGIRESLGTMYRTEGPDRMMARSGMPARAPGFWEYVGRVRSAAGR